MDPSQYALLFLGAFASWFLLGILYSIHVDERKSARKVPVVRIVTRGHIRVKIVPLAYRPLEHMPLDLTLDDDYKGCLEALLRQLGEEAKDNL